MFIGTFATAFALAFPYNARDLQHDLRAVIHIGGRVCDRATLCARTMIHTGSYTCRRPAPFFSDDPGCDSCRELYAVGLAEFCDRLFFPTCRVAITIMRQSRHTATLLAPMIMVDARRRPPSC